MEIMGREYTIGETAQLLNVTRDTLRFYEKKKLIVPRKEANGYRYYSGEDIQLLLDLIFLRKLQYSIQDIQLLCEDGDMDSMCDCFELRMKEEEELIRRHQQILQQLIVTRYTREKIRKYFQRYVLRPIPRTYIFSPTVSDYDAVREEWFKLLEENKKLNCYLHEQWNILGDKTVNHQCYLILEEHAVKLLGLEENAKHAPFFSFDQSVYTIYASKTVSPQQEDIQKIIHWAREQNIAVTGEIHAHYLWNHYQEGKLQTSYIELYLPVKPDS